MKTFISLSLLFIGFLQAHTELLLSAATNTLAIYLVDDDVPHESLIVSTAMLKSLKLESPPILADSDFVAWDVTNHTFVITPTAAKRVVGSCDSRIVPFVLIANGERIYLGKFGTITSSFLETVPVVLTDLVVGDCFMGITNVPADVLPMIASFDFRVTDRLMAITNAATNVTLRIHQGYPLTDYGLGVERRGDKRIAIAVEKLFAKTKK